MFSDEPDAFRFLLDENVGEVLEDGLQQHWPDIDVMHVGQPSCPARGTKDPEILAWCESRSVLLVTNNRRSMPLHLRDHLAAGRTCPGILVIRQNVPLRDVIEELGLIWMAGTRDRYRDTIVYIPSEDH